jgi:diguanylate cyclase (GGDEF)-like protein
VAVMIGVNSDDNESGIRTSGADRDRTADARDAASVATDEISEGRDEQSEARDDRANAREEDTSPIDMDSRSDRAAAKRDRKASATDRVHALHDREASESDRVASSRERSQLLLDDLTGAHRRTAGLSELEREVNRAHRTDKSFALAFIDVDGLKDVNDTMGHSAGDELLVKVVKAMRSHVRSYDLVVRYGGDEFLCGLPDMNLVEAEKRVALVNRDLGSAGHVTAGLALLKEEESLADLILRADEDLYRRREASRAPRAPGN